MPSVIARRKCPDLIFAQPRFDVYKEVSLQIRAIFAEHTAIIEPLSLDEAYLDVTENLQGIASGTEIAEQIRAKIRAETLAGFLRCRVGRSFCHVEIRRACTCFNTVDELVKSLKSLKGPGHGWRDLLRYRTLLVIEELPR
jgi:nucleotidyltransferase/DNA polymerase involved in DNA repair